MKTTIADRSMLIAASAAILLAAACGSSGSSASPTASAPAASAAPQASVVSTRNINGEIKDNAIILSSPIGAPVLQLELRNAGTKECKLTIALTSMPMDALPVKNGRVLIDAGGQPGVIWPEDGGNVGGSPDDYIVARIQPGSVFKREVAMEGAPKTDDRIILCNGVGDYKAGRYAVLRFQR